MSVNPQNRNPDQNRAAVTLLVLAIALVVRFANLLLLQRAPFFSFKIGDAARYDQWGQNIAAGDWIGQGVFYQAPLYPYFLGVIYSLLGDDIMTVRKIQAIIGAVSCVLLMNGVWNLFNRRAGIAAGIVMALYVPSLFLETLIQKSVLDLFFICLIIWLVSKINLQSRLRIWLGLGATIGALCLTRENALALIPFFALWSLVAKRGTTDGAPAGRGFPVRAKTLVTLMAGLAMVMGPVAVRNYLVGGEFHITTSQLGPNFYIGNNPQANGTYRPLLPGRGDAIFEQQDAVALATAAMGRELTPAEVSRYYVNESAEYIRQQPGDWAQLLGRKTLLSVNATELIDTEDQYTYESWSPLMRVLSPIFHFGLLAPLALIGIWRIRRQWRDYWILLIVVALFQATMIAFFVFGRYRFPIVPLLIVFAAPLIADIATHLLQRWRQACGHVADGFFSRGAIFAASIFVDTKCHWKPAAVAVIVFAISLLPLESRETARAVTYNNFGVQMMLRGEFEEARDYFERCLALTPDDALAHNNLGVVYREQSRHDLAIEHFQSALRIEPQYETAKRNLQRLQKS